MARKTTRLRSPRRKTATSFRGSQPTRSGFPESSARQGKSSSCGTMTRLTVRRVRRQRTRGWTYALTIKELTIPSLRKGRRHGTSTMGSGQGSWERINSHEECICSQSLLRSGAPDGHTSRRSAAAPTHVSGPSAPSSSIPGTTEEFGHGIGAPGLHDSATVY